MNKILQNLPKAALWAISSYINPLSLLPLLLVELNYFSSPSSLISLLTVLGLPEGSLQSTLPFKAEVLCWLIGMDCSVIMVLAAVISEDSANSVVEAISDMAHGVAGNNTASRETEGTVLSYGKKGMEVAELAVEAGKHGLKTAECTQKAWKRLWD